MDPVTVSFDEDNCSLKYQCGTEHGLEFFLAVPLSISPSLSQCSTFEARCLVFFLVGERHRYAGSTPYSIRESMLIHVASSSSLSSRLFLSQSPPCLLPPSSQFRNNYDIHRRRIHQGWPQCVRSLLSHNHSSSSTCHSDPT